jgi:hypothetical protein
MKRDTGTRSEKRTTYEKQSGERLRKKRKARKKSHYADLRDFRLFCFLFTHETETTHNTRRLADARQLL